MQGCRKTIWKSVLALALLAAVPGWGAGKVGVAHVQGTIGPATAGYLARAIDEAAKQNVQCLVIQLDTPGGLLDATKEIIQVFFRSPVPTVVYVSPPGAWAGSAGCFLTMKQKLENFASSYIEAVAAKRHRNTEWARASVRESAAITADKALELNVIDLIAKDLPDLLRQLDGREVNGRTLQTAGAAILEIPMTVQENVFQVIAHPQVMLILMLIVMYGVIGEMTSPGAILPGVAGVISLLVLLYLASILPMNIAGLALIGVAIALFLVDVFAPTHGVLTGGGIVAFFLGTLMLFDRSEPFLRLSLAWTLPATVVTALFFIFIVGAGLRAQRMPARTGAEMMIGQRVTALARIQADGGRVFLEGEYWNAVSEEPVEAGQSAEIIALEGLTLKVKPTTTAKEVGS